MLLRIVKCMYVIFTFIIYDLAGAGERCLTSEQGERPAEAKSA